MKWTAGVNIGTVFKGTFSSSNNGVYNGHIHFGTGLKSRAKLVASGGVFGFC